MRALLREHTLKYINTGKQFTNRAPVHDSQIKKCFIWLRPASNTRCNSLFIECHISRACPQNHGHIILHACITHMCRVLSAVGRTVHGSSANAVPARLIPRPLPDLPAITPVNASSRFAAAFTVVAPAAPAPAPPFSFLAESGAEGAGAWKARCAGLAL